MFFKAVLIQLTFFVLVGCSGRGFFEFNAEAGGYYLGAEVSDHNGDYGSNMWFGPYRLRRFTGGFQGLTEFYEQGLLPDSQINAWWQVHYKDKADKFFYARTLPNQGIQADTMHFWSDWKYFAYISFGPMYLADPAVNKMQSESSHIKLIRTSKWSGAKYFTWGKESSVYYSVLKENIDPQMKPIENWIEVQGIAITKKQFLLLNTRCGKPWLKTRCFMDESFPDLTSVQLAYIIAHEHEDDEYWLSDDAEPPEVKEKVNYWL